MYSIDVEPAGPAQPWDPAAVDWDAVRRDALEHRAECETRAQQVVAEARAAARPLRLKDQEERARWQANVDAVDELVRVIDDG